MLNLKTKLQTFNSMAMTYLNKNGVVSQIHGFKSYRKLKWQDSNVA